MPVCPWQANNVQWANIHDKKNSNVYHGASLFSNGAAAQSEESAQALTHDPLPNIGGNGNDTQTRSISREALVFTLSTAMVT